MKTDCMAAFNCHRSSNDDTVMSVDLKKAFHIFKVCKNEALEFPPKFTLFLNKRFQANSRSITIKLLVVHAQVHESSDKQN